MMAYMLVKSDVDAYYVHADNLSNLAGEPGLSDWMGWNDQKRKMMTKDAQRMAAE